MRHVDVPISDSENASQLLHPRQDCLSMSTNAKQPYHTGHRERLREEVLQNLHMTQEYKLLELLLTYALPRVDTKPIARELLQEFGTLRGVLDARVEQLGRVQGIGPRCAELIVLMRELWVRYEAGAQVKKRILNSNKIVADQARARLRGLPREQLWAVYVDTRHRELSWKMFAEGTLDAAAYHQEEVLREGMMRHAWGFYLIHNHPGGSGPSREDIISTQRLIEATKGSGLKLIEHLIITETDYHGLREQKFLPSLEEETRVRV